MNPKSIEQQLESLKIHPDKILDEDISNAITLLFQLVEESYIENEKLKTEIQKLRDEINLLKGEQGKPDIPSSKKKQKGDISSENERKKQEPPKQKRSKAKKHKIKIDRTEICTVDQTDLPDDAEFKGYQDIVVQGIIIKTDNVEYKKEVYYSASENKTYIGKLPTWVEGEFSPEIKSLVYTMKYVSNMSEKKIHEFLKNFGIHISPATISRILTKNNELFDQEKADIVLAGISSTRYQQIDDTCGRVRGQNQFVQILCNPYYTAYFTIPHKDRLSILKILQGSEIKNYNFNEEAFTLLEKFRLTKNMIAQIRDMVFGQILDNEQMEQLLEKIFPDPGKGKNLRKRIMEAGAIAAYQQQTDYPIIQILLSDDARQFKLITKWQALCWVHDGRNYKKLHPIVPLHKEKLEKFLDRYWNYYGKLLEYKKNPSSQMAKILSAEFDKLFSTKTKYRALDERIAKTKANKTQLLLVLKYPELPLHNNDAELGARAQVRKRDVSLHTMTKDGTKANDTFMTIVQTAKKLGVSSYEYIHDRVSKSFCMPSLSELIEAKKIVEINIDAG
ncbi:MAG: transposase [Methanosarcinales archaeon]|nr:transposase [Methanosarcinales archaeon]